MHEFSNGVQFRNLGDLFLDEVFHRLYVMVGGAFNALDPFRVCQIELRNHSIQKLVGVGREGRHLGDAGMGRQFLQPAELNGHAVPDQAIFTENVTKNADFTAIASIDRGNGGQGVEFHRKPLKSSKIRSKEKLGAHMIHQWWPGFSRKPSGLPSPPIPGRS